MLNRVALALFLVLLYDLIGMPTEVAAFPAPFTRVLTLKEPPIEGKKNHTYAVEFIDNGLMTAAKRTCKACVQQYRKEYMAF